MADYLSSTDRRTTLKWLGIALTSPILLQACGRSETNVEIGSLLGDPLPVSGTRIGSDPDLLDPKVTWQKTMSARQLQLVAALTDVLLPKTQDRSSGSEIGVPDFVDEWVSAPYEINRADRVACFQLFEWLEAEARNSNGITFAECSVEMRAKILDRFAWMDRIEAGLETQASTFEKFRNLAVSAYLCSAEGSEWLGYMGNRPATGDYAGPTEEALMHLQTQLTALDLSIPTNLK